MTTSPYQKPSEFGIALPTLRIGVDRIIVNKVQSGEPMNDIARTFPSLPIAACALAPAELLGLPVLETYMEANPNAFEGLQI